MKTVYFILDITDNNNLRISGNPFTIIKNDCNCLELQMLRDISFSGKACLNQEISNIIVSVEVKNYLDYLKKAMNLIDEYKDKEMEIFNNTSYKNVLKYTFKINPDQSIQKYSNAEIKFDISEIKENKDIYWYYSNPLIIIKHY